MPLIKWTPEYSVNNDELDRHHQQMFNILNTVYENIMMSREADCILPIIDELEELSSYHIAVEEQYMREIENLDITDHIAMHRDFTNKMDVLRSSYYYSNNLEVTKELIILLGEWLLHHIINEDWKYSEMSTGIKS